MHRYILIGVTSLIGMSLVHAHENAQIEHLYKNTIIGIDRFALPVCYRVKDDLYMCLNNKPALMCNDQCATLIEFALRVFNTPVMIKPSIPAFDIRLQFNVREAYLNLLLSIAVRPEHALHDIAVSALSQIKSDYIEQTMSKLKSPNLFDSYNAAMVLTNRSANEYPMTILLLNDPELIKTAQEMKDRVHSNQYLIYDLKEEYLKFLQFEFNKAHSSVNQIDELRMKKYKDISSLKQFDARIIQMVQDIKQSMNAIIVYNEYFTHELPGFKNQLNRWIMHVVRPVIADFERLLHDEINEAKTRGAEFVSTLGMPQQEALDRIESLQEGVEAVHKAYIEVFTKLDIKEWINTERNAFEILNMNR